MKYLKNTLSHLLLVVILLIMSASCSEDELIMDLSHEQNNELSELVVKKTGLKMVNSLLYNDSAKSGQGVAIDGRIMYRLYDSGLCQSFDISDVDNPKSQSVFKLGSYQTSNHGNSAQFFIEGGDHLLFVAGLNNHCYVELIENGSSELIQTISVSLNNYTSDFNIICGDDGALWAFGGMIPNGLLSVFKFRRPLLTEGDVTLSEKDLLDEWIIDSNYSYYDHVWQGGKVYDGKLYFVFGSSSKGKRVVIYDIVSYERIKEIVLDDIVKEEPEDCEYYDGKLLVVVNGGAGYYIID